MLVGFVGPMGAGKTAAARYLEGNYNCARTRFAGPLKRMARALGLTEAQVDGHQKEVPSDLLCGKTPRYAMQTIGTEWGRDLIGEDLWVNAWKQEAEKLLCSGRGVVVDDVRFYNEIAVIEELGGFVVRVVPSNVDASATHASEALWRELPAKYEVVNCYTERFFEKIAEIVAKEGC